MRGAYFITMRARLIFGLASGTYYHAYAATGNIR